MSSVESLDFEKNLQFETIISDILKQNYSIVDDFFKTAEVNQLRGSLLEKHAANVFKKAAIGNKENALIVKTIRGDNILWLDELQTNSAEQHFFNNINSLVNYLNQTCFLGIIEKEFHYAIYPKNTFYIRHVDTFLNDNRRKLSIVCYLNEPG